MKVARAPGERVLILGGAGSVGAYAVQLARGTVEKLPHGQSPGNDLAASLRYPPLPGFTPSGFPGQVEALGVNLT